MARLVNENLHPGVYAVNWTANNVATGVSFVRMIAGQYVATRKTMVVK